MRTYSRKALYFWLAHSLTFMHFKEGFNMDNETYNTLAYLEDLHAFDQFRKDHPTIRCDQCCFSEKLDGKPDKFFFFFFCDFASLTFH